MLLHVVLMFAIFLLLSTSIFQIIMKITFIVSEEQDEQVDLGRLFPSLIHLRKRMQEKLKNLSEKGSNSSHYHSFHHRGQRPQKRRSSSHRAAQDVRAGDMADQESILLNIARENQHLAMIDLLNLASLRILLVVVPENRILVADIRNTLLQMTLQGSFMEVEDAGELLRRIRSGARGVGISERDEQDK